MCDKSHIATFWLLNYMTIMCGWGLPTSREYPQISSPKAAREHACLMSPLCTCMHTTSVPPSPCCRNQKLDSYDPNSRRLAAWAVCSVEGGMIRRRQSHDVISGQGQGAHCPWWVAEIPVLPINACGPVAWTNSPWLLWRKWLPKWGWSGRHNENCLVFTMQNITYTLSIYSNYIQFDSIGFFHQLFIYNRHTPSKKSSHSMMNMYHVD